MPRKATWSRRKERHMRQLYNLTKPRGICMPVLLHKEGIKDTSLDGCPCCSSGSLTFPCLRSPRRQRRKRISSTSSESGETTIDQECDSPTMSDSLSCSDSLIKNEIEEIEIIDSEGTEIIAASETENNQQGAALRRSPRRQKKRKLSSTGNSFSVTTSKSECNRTVRCTSKKQATIQSDCTIIDRKCSVTRLGPASRCARFVKESARQTENRDIESSEVVSGPPIIQVEQQASDFGIPKRPAGSPTAYTRLLVIDVYVK